MKVVLLIFSLFFLVSAANDCCLTELEEELTKVSKTTHADDDDDHSEDSEACEECQCSTFCSYNIITVVSHSNLLLPFSSIQEVCFFSEPVKEKNIPESIFHPPIV
jgi:hypothetical protein